MKNDLHIRTNISASSNVEMNWEKVLTMAEKNGLNRISITDFDTCLFSIIKKVVSPKKFFKGEIIDGMECDVCHNGLTFELLAYNFDVDKTFEWSLKTYGTLQTRQTKLKDMLLEKLKNADLVFTEREFQPDKEFAHNYIYEGLSNSHNDEFFKTYNISNGSDFYRQSTTNNKFPLYVNTGLVWPEPVEVIKAIHSFGGIVVLAHPFKYKDKLDVTKLLDFAKNNAIDGIEVFHPTHSKENINMLLSFAKKNNMLITGGSNFNGKDYLEMGIKNIDKDEEEIILER